VQLTQTTPDRGWEGVDLYFRARRVGRFHLEGEPHAIALTPARVAVLADDGSSDAIEVRTASGALTQKVPVSKSIAPELAMSGRWLVYHVGRDIFALDITSGQTRRIARAGANVLGLSIEGRRVAWGEQRQVVAVRLPK
jgi:hypothetical protein